MKKMEMKYKKLGSGMKAESAYTLMIDSGIGGLSVLALAHKMLPQENFYFYADAANAPYGDKQPYEIINILHSIIEKHSHMPIKAILLACNTATSAAAAKLRSELPIPVIGMEPALKPAALNTKGRVLVMATQLTIREEKFRKLLGKFEEGRDIISLPCPGLMEIVEKSPKDSAAENYLTDRLRPYADNLEAIVLGCTHYVFLRPVIEKIFPKIRIYDGNEGVVRHLNTILAEYDRSGGNGYLRVDCSLPPGPEKTAYLNKCNAMLSYCDDMYMKQSPNC